LSTAVAADIQVSEVLMVPRIVAVRGVKHTKGGSHGNTKASPK